MNYISIFFKKFNWGWRGRRDRGVSAVSTKVILGIELLAFHSSAVLFPPGEVGVHRNWPLSKRSCCWVLLPHSLWNRLTAQEGVSHLISPGPDVPPDLSLTEDTGFIKLVSFSSPMSQRGKRIMRWNQKTSGNRTL